MSNTIELLEIIGSDASLRHATAQDLARSLARMHATESLQKAAATGDNSPLEEELGHRIMMVVKNPTQGGYEDDDDDAGELPDPPDHDMPEKLQS